MRRLMAALLLAGLMVPLCAADDTKPKDDPKAKKADPKKKTDDKKPKITLKVGDAAPKLKADRWLQNEEVKTFEPGKVYVVEFWATWCGPCISAMPHLSHLQSEFKDKGVTFIGYTKKDPNNTADQVTEFVEKRGPKLKYTFAYSDGPEIYDAWMTAAGRNGIPCTFVVGKDSKLAYIGHPIYLDSVIPKVVDGTWDSEEGMKEVKRVTKDLMALNGVVGGRTTKDPEAQLKAIDEFEKQNPGMARAGYFASERFTALVKLSKAAEAKALAEKILNQSVETADVSRLQSMGMALRTAGEGDKEFLPLAIRAAQANLAVTGDKDPIALLNLAKTYKAAGDKAKVGEFADKAVATANAKSPQLKNYVEKEVSKLKEKSE